MYYQATVTISEVGKSGGTKKSTEQYLIDAVSYTDAETKVTKKYFGFTLDWSITSLKKSRILEIIK